ncbi:MAG: helix-turn-helix domain-containing protein [Sphingobium sp.]
MTRAVTIVTDMLPRTRPDAVSDAEPFATAPPPTGARPVGDPVLDAAAQCVRRKGFDNISLEEVATEAAVSRTTLYRRFGNRENLFRALLRERARPFRAWSRQVLMGPGTPEERLETVLTHAIIEMQRVGWLDHTIAGISAASARLIKAAHAEGASDTIGPVLEMLMPPEAAQAGITVADLIEWSTDQMIALASARAWDEQSLRCRLRYFVLPVLAPRAAPSSTDARLAAIEQKIDQLATRP